MAETSPLVYGVWIEGQGWLKDHSGRHFADMRREYAEEVLRFIIGTPAHVALIDDSMIALEQLFLEKEQERSIKALRKEAQRFNLFTILRIRT
jgi:hypothetical protein